jgi:hypothetical protein
VFYRLPRLAIVAALACSIGLHWGFLQSVAWVGMVVSYSQEAPLKEALAKTFDGKHPCCLCKAIVAGKKSEKKSDTPLPLKKFEGLRPAVAAVVFPPASFPRVQAQEAFFETRSHAPLTPPPRGPFA